MKEEIDVIATLIRNESYTTIITPSGKLFLYDGKVRRVEPVREYSSAVNDEIDAIKKMASGGLHTGDYLIQMYGKMPDPKSPIK